ncbi:MAG: zinc ribbon domain-containing protein [Firmicutes bacterium]|nr:zinc ribbon domain-containing protein [Bacillota bacterium]
MFCSKCGTKNGSNAQFCSKCGNVLAAQQQQTFCGSCGTSNAPNMRFCSKCGNNLANAQQTNNARPGGGLLNKLANAMGNNNMGMGGMRMISVTRGRLAHGQQVIAEIWADNQLVGRVANNSSSDFSVPMNARTIYAVMPRGTNWSVEVRSNTESIPSNNSRCTFSLTVVPSGLLGLGTPKLDLRFRG